MSSLHLDLLHGDIERHWKGLQSVFARLRANQNMDTAMLSSLIENGLIAAHTLKALSAVKQCDQLVVFCTRLEDAFIQAQAHRGDSAAEKALRETILSMTTDIAQLALIIQDWQRAYLRYENSKSAVDALYQLEQSHLPQRIRKPQVFEKSILPTDISIDMLFQSFTPWLNQTAQQAQKSVQIEIEAPDAIILKTATVAPLQTALVHLLRNALFHGIESVSLRKQFNKNVSGIILLRAILIQEDELLQIQVIDDGKGFIPNTPNTAFTPISFPSAPHSTYEAETTAVQTSIYTVANTGLGIGLHIVESQLASLGGSLDILSTPGTGTVMTMTLPYAPFQSQGQGQNQTEDSADIA